MSKKPWKERIGKAIAMCMYEYTYWIYIRGLLWPPLNVCIGLLLPCHVSVIQHHKNDCVRYIFERWMFESGKLLLRLISLSRGGELSAAMDLNCNSSQLMPNNLWSTEATNSSSAALRTGWDDCDWLVCMGKTAFSFQNFAQNHYQFNILKKRLLKDYLLILVRLLDCLL